jgi:hypothetical protein
MANEFLPLFSFRIPAFRNDVSFKQSFVSSIKESATTTFVTELDNARENMHNQLDQLKLDTVKPEPSLEAIDTYLPLIYTLSDAVNASTEDIPLQRRQVFEWRGALGELPSASRFHSSADMAFEIIMCLHARATLLHMTAKVNSDVSLMSHVPSSCLSCLLLTLIYPHAMHATYATHTHHTPPQGLLDADMHANLVEASKLMREAAGVWAFMSTAVIPHWTTALKGVRLLG